MSNAGQVLEAFRVMTAHKSLSRDELHDLIRDGIHAALAKRFGPNVQAEIGIDEEQGKIDIVVLKEVVEEVRDPSREIGFQEARWDDPDFQVGDLMEIPVAFEEFGRTAVLAAKQRIIQRVREGERDRIREEFSDRVGELLSGEVQAIERGKLVVMLNKLREAEAIIPWREQNRRERFRQGEPIRAVLKKLDETPKGPRLILSRADPLFVAALFRLEVPEIYQGIVKISDIAREAGGRTKVAVVSNDDSIDPVGACVGLKGSRVQAVVSELHGERIDIVPWHPDPEVYAKRALAPAQVAKVLADRDRKVITAIVDEDQLSLAIGRNGQNVRLASQLIGWQIDLYSTREWMERGAKTTLFGGPADEEEAADFPLRELDIAPVTLAALEAAGHRSFLDIIDLEVEDFLRIDGVGEEEAKALVALIDDLTIVEDGADGGDDSAEAAESAESDEAAAETTEAEAESDGVAAESAEASVAPEEAEAPSEATAEIETTEAAEAADEEAAGSEEEVVDAAPPETAETVSAAAAEESDPGDADSDEEAAIGEMEEVERTAPALDASAAAKEEAEEDEEDAAAEGESEERVG